MNLVLRKMATVITSIHQRKQFLYCIPQNCLKKITPFFTHELYFQGEVLQKEALTISLPHSFSLSSLLSLSPSPSLLFSPTISLSCSHKRTHICTHNCDTLNQPTLEYISCSSFRTSFISWSSCFDSSSPRHSFNFCTALLTATPQRWGSNVSIATKQATDI